jgi:hypothetical protein
MTRQAEARILHEPTPAVERAIRQLLDVPLEAATAADQAYVMEAIGSVSWERRGLFQRLTRRPRPRRAASS